MKSLIIVTLALGLGLMFFFYRRRLKMALMLVGGSYIVLTVARLIILREEVDRFAELGLALGALAVAWLLMNVATRLLQRRRERRIRR